MLKGFLSGLSISIVALVALSLAVPLAPDPAEGSPAPTPVLAPLTGIPQVATDPVADPIALRPSATPRPQPAPAALPSREADRPARFQEATPVAAPAAAPFVAVTRQGPLDTVAAAPPMVALPGRTAPRSDEEAPRLAVPAAPDHVAIAATAPQPPAFLRHVVAPVRPDPVAPLQVQPVLTSGPQPAPPPPNRIPVAGLRSDRLPQIGVAPPAESQRQGRRAARERHAMDFSPAPAGRPLVAVVLTHAGVLPNQPVTLAFDPLAPDAAEAARTWRRAGGEVAILGTGLPAGASSRDAEITLQNHLRSLPEAVALVDLPEGSITRSRVVATQIIAILAEDGHGLVTQGTGLNAAVRMAEDAGVAALTVTARIATTDDATAMRRILDRAGLRAVQHGEALIFAAGTPDVIDALAEWLETGRGAGLALVPLSVLLNR